MLTTSRKTSHARFFPMVLLATLLGLLSIHGCGPEKPAGFDDFAPHTDILVGSDGSGSLAAWFDFSRPIVVPCELLADVFLCSTTDPGFGAITVDSGGYRPLSTPNVIALEILANDSGIQVKRGESVAMRPGDRVELGSGSDLHTHVEWLMIGSSLTEEVGLELRLIEVGSSPRYTPSQPFVLRFRLG